MINAFNLFNISEEETKINIKRIDDKTSPPAYTKLEYFSYTIFVNDFILNRLKYKNIINQALIMHEMSHIEFLTFRQFTYADDFDKYLDNLLEDARVEYRLSLKYPVVAKYFSLTLDLFRNNVDTSSYIIDEAAKLDDVEERLEHLQELNNQIYDFVRFDKLPKDEKLRDYMLPLLISSKRGNRDNSREISIVLYRFLMYYTKLLENKFDSNLQIKMRNNFTNSNNDESEEVITKIAKQTKKLKEEEENDKKKDKGSKTNETNKSFYNKSVRKNIDLILEVEKEFKKILNKDIKTYVKEGELPTDVNKMQQLYINSFTGEEEKTFVNTKKIETELDVIILRDISYSVNDFAKEYAEILSVFLESLSRFKHVRTASADFGYKGELIKKFENDNPKITPRNSGTTNLGDCLELISDELKWKHKNKLLIITTDGRPDDEQYVFQMLGRSFFKGVKILPIILGDCTGDLFNNQIKIDEISDIPKAIANYVRDNYGGIR
jgi:hypothetical protein